MEIRHLENNDFDKGYLSLLKQLTIVGTVTKDEFEVCFNQLNTNIYVIEIDNHIVATGTLLIEQKFIHNLACVGHIEDIVVDLNYRGKKLGKKIIQHLINVAYDNKCYKVILNCDDSLVNFYGKLGFHKKNIEMSKYFV